MSARKHPNRMPAATLWWLPAFLSRYGLFTVYKKFMISSTLYLETRYFNDNYSICRIYVFSVHLGNGPLKFLILGTQQEIRQMYDSYTFDISSGQFIHGHNVLGIVVFDFQQVYDFPVRGVG